MAEDDDARARGQALVRTESPARPVRVAPLSTRARTMVVGLAPEQALAALMASPRMTERSLDADQLNTRAYDDGQHFYEVAPDGALVIWRRPTHTWLDFGRGVLEPIPYPDCLHIQVGHEPRGSKVEMRWQRHPLTRTSLWFNLTGAGIGLIFLTLCMVLAGISPTLWAVLIVTMGLLSTPIIRRFAFARRARTSLLRGAYTALASHELAAAETDASAFRAQLPPPASEDRPAG